MMLFEVPSSSVYGGPEKPIGDGGRNSNSVYGNTYDS